MDISHTAEELEGRAERDGRVQTSSRPPGWPSQASVGAVRHAAAALGRDGWIPARGSCNTDHVGRNHPTLPSPPPPTPPQLQPDRRCHIKCPEFNETVLALSLLSEGWRWRRGSSLHNEGLSNYGADRTSDSSERGKTQERGKTKVDRTRPSTPSCSLMRQGLSVARLALRQNGCRREGEETKRMEAAYLLYDKHHFY
ncbi:uncharacterized [Tachysurus ichikawai]